MVTGVCLFCVRLACGLMGSLLVLTPSQVNPRFYRVHFLIALGILAVPLVLGWRVLGAWEKVTLFSALTLAFFGSLVWSLEGAPAGRLLAVLTFVATIIALLLAERDLEPGDHIGFAWLFAGDLTSAAVLGTAMTAMLMGHSYLIAPAMSLTPLLRLLLTLLAAILCRLAVAGIALFRWTEGHSLTNLTDETVLWLPARWALGFVVPLLLAWMAWKSARIRSTQSATGILYALVICCFLGELTSQLLLSHTHYTL